MIASIRKSTFHLVLLTCIICVVESRPARQSQCREGFYDFDGDCVPVKLVKDFRRLLCELRRYLNHNDSFKTISSLCPTKENSEEKRFWGNKGYLDDSREIDDEKRAWWHSGIKS